MVAVCDIGNTNIHMGVYDAENLIKHTRLPHVKDFPESRIMKLLRGSKLEGAAVASVVPKLTRRVCRLLKRYYKIAPLVVRSDLKYPVRITYRTPDTLGADRIANVVGGFVRYRKNLIIIGFGTATIFDVVLKDGTYIGGMITPGLVTSMDALVSRTALLKRVPLEMPSRLVGTTTSECIQSGIMNGTIAMVRGIVQYIKKTHKRNFYCIATGGLGTRIAPHVSVIKRYEPDLSFFGLLKIFQHNVS